MNTKYYLLFLTITLFSLFSCTNEKLEKKILELELLNKQLLDSLKKQEYKDILSYQMVLSTEDDNFKIGEKKKVYASFVKYDYIHNFDVYYSADKDGIILKNQKFSKFEFDFTPKTENDTVISIIASFNVESKNEEIMIYGRRKINVEK